MSTLYDLFKVKENVSPEEIQKAYEEILKKADSLPQTEKMVDQVQRIKIAYGILSDPEKRKKYDFDLANQKADELLKNIKIKKEEEQETEFYPNKDFSEIKRNEPQIKQEIERQIEKMIEAQNLQEKKKKLDDFKQEEQLKKRLRKQERKNRRQAKKAQQLKREMEINAYGEFLQKQGYKVTYPWTWLRIKRLMISIIVVIIGLWIFWQIPYVRKMLTDLYDENFVIKFLVDMLLSMFNGIKENIKSIFNK